MKELADKTQVTDRSYYYLLDWNEGHRDYMYLAFTKDRLCDLNKIEYMKLFKHATAYEYGQMKAIM